MYIVFEGIVGTGKTTQSKRLVEWLQKQFPNRKVVWTREPGGTEIADAIRNVVQGCVYKEPMEVMCEAYLYASSRAQSLRTVVKPCLDAGGIVVADRSFITSLVYQGYARGLGAEVVREINKFAVGGMLPDAVLFLDLSVSTALSRAHDQAGDKWEKLGEDFFTKVHEGYRQVSNLSEFSGKWITVNAEGTPEEVFERVLTAVQPLIANL